MISKTPPTQFQEKKAKRIPLKREQYRAYINSEEWQDVRRRYWASRLPKCCYCCGIKDVPLDLHHTTYKRLGREYLTDLVLVCRPCHESIHGLQRRKGIRTRAATRKFAQKVRKKIKKKQRRKERRMS